MHKYLIGTTMLVALVGVAIASSASGRGPVQTSTESLEFTAPNNMGNNVFVSGGVDAHLTTVVNGDSSTNPTHLPDPTKQVKLSFDHQGKVTTSAAPQCTANLNGTTTAQAKAACPAGSNIGSGAAHICINDGTGGCLPQSSTGTGVVTAFNGPTGNKIRFHVRFDQLSITTVITGTLSNISTSGDYNGGKLLTVPVPQIAGGSGALTDFTLHVQHGKYIQAKCQTTDTKIDTKATFTYYGGTVADHPKHAQTCTV